MRLSRVVTSDGGAFGGGHEFHGVGCWCGRNIPCGRRNLHFSSPPTTQCWYVPCGPEAYLPQLRNPSPIRREERCENYPRGSHSRHQEPFSLSPLTQRRWSGVNDSHSNTRQRVDPTPEPPPGRIGPLCRMAWWPTVTGRRVIVRRDYGRSVTFDPSVSQEPERLGPPETHPLMGPTS